MERKKLMDVFMQEISEIRFNDIDDYFRKKEVIKEKLQTLDVNSKQIYKWYFYHQLCMLGQKQYEFRDLMWRYVIGENVLLDLMLCYRLFCEKRNKIDYTS